MTQAHRGWARLELKRPTWHCGELPSGSRFSASVWGPGPTDLPGLAGMGVGTSARESTGSPALGVSRPHRTSGTCLSIRGLSGHLRTVHTACSPLVSPGSTCSREM